MPGDGAERRAREGRPLASTRCSGASPACSRSLLLLAAWEILARSGTFTHFQLPALQRGRRTHLERRLDRRSLRSTPRSRSIARWPRFLICAVFGVIDRHGDVAQRDRQLVLRSDHFGRLSDAEDRLPAGGDPVARRLRRVQDHHHRHRRDLPGDRRHRHRHPGRGARTDLVGAQHGRERTRTADRRSCCRRRCRRS